MNDGELIKNLTKLKVKVFTHNDLDGISCSIVLKKLYSSNNIAFDFSFIGYDEIRNIGDFFENYEESKNYDFVFITDINIKPQDYDILKPSINHFLNNKNNYQNKEKVNFFKKLFIIDHHKDSEETFRKIENIIFNKIEYYNDTTHCATYQLFDWCVNQRSRIWNEYVIGSFHKNYEINEKWLREYIELVNDWDLFLWKDKHNIIARDLNLLFNHTRRAKFIMMQEQKLSLHFSFNSTEKTVIKETMESINKEFQLCMKNNAIVNLRNPITNEVFKHVNCLVIKTDENISLICDMFKDMIINEHLFHPYKIDIIVNISFKYGAINFRRVNEKIDLKEIANWYGGGGHPFASGCPLNSEDKNLMNDFVNPLIMNAYKPSHREE